MDVADRVRFTGYQPDVTPFYDAMDVSVLTSLSEGLSITLLESMSHRLPVVVTAVGGNPEVVIDGETGFLVPPRDVAAFVTQVTRLAHDPELRARFGTAARLRVARSFSRDRAASRYLDVYQEALSSG